MDPLREAYETSLTLTQTLKRALDERDGANVALVKQPDIQPSQAVLVSPGKLPWLRTSSLDGEYNPKSPTQRIICAYKVALGIPWDDRAWDKVMYSRYVKAANQFLSAFRDEQTAAEFLIEYGEKMKDKGLTWGFDAAVREAWNTRGARQ